MAVIMLNKDNYEQEVMKSDKPVLVDFFATWCGPCQMQGPIIDELAEEMTDVKFCKIDIDENPDLAQENGVMTIPTIMIVKNGEITYKKPGLQQKKALIKLLK